MKNNKSYKYDKRVLEYKDDIDYWDKLNDEDTGWLKQVLAEEYSNDHSKQNSIYRKVLGDDYDKNKKYTNIYGQLITLKQVKFTEFNEKIRDLMSNLKNSEKYLNKYEREYLKEKINEKITHIKSLDTSNYNTKKKQKIQKILKELKERIKDVDITIDLDKISDLSYDDISSYEDFVNFESHKEDGTTVHSLLKHYTFEEVLKLLKEDFISKIKEGDINIKPTLDVYTWKIMLLFKRILYIHNRNLSIKREERS